MDFINGVFVTLLAFSPAAASDDNAILPVGDVEMKCQEEATTKWLGQTLDVRTEEEIKHAANAKSVRVGKPGSAFTMDFREDRVNVIVDEKDVITRIYCG